MIQTIKHFFFPCEKRLTTLLSLHKSAVEDNRQAKIKLMKAVSDNNSVLILKSHKG